MQLVNAKFWMSNIIGNRNQSIIASGQDYIKLADFQNDRVIFHEIRIVEDEVVKFSIYIKDYLGKL